MPNLTFLDRIAAEFSKEPEIANEIQSIIELVESGDLHAALDKLNSRYPQFLVDFPGLKNHLERQEYIESIRKTPNVEESLTALKDYAKSTRSQFNKDSVLMLFYRDAKDIDSPVSVEMDFERRSELADVLERHLLVHTRYKDPLICLLLRYLTLIANMYCALHGLDTNLPVLEKLIRPDRKPQISTICSSSAADGDGKQVSDAEIYTLCQLVSISPKEAENALISHGGDIKDALISELMRIEVNFDLLRNLVSEYNRYRGISSHSDLRNATGGDSAVTTGKKRDREDKIVEYPRDKIESMQAIQRLLSNLRSDWIKLAGQGKVEECIQSISQLAPMFFQQNPCFDFHLKRWKFFDLLSVTGVVSPQCVKLVQSDLASLSRNNQQLESAFRETASFLLCPPKVEEIGKYISVSFPAEIYHALADCLEIREPQLVILIDRLLEFHGKCFKERSETDRFESLFGIDDLRENVLASSVAGFASVDRMQTESDAFFDDSQVVKAEMDADEAGLNKEDIDSVIDVLACSRLEAISLLLQYKGNVNDAFSALFGS